MLEMSPQTHIKDHKRDFTTVQPLWRLCWSLWAWAQKSMHAVTPENGRPSFKPSLQSGALASDTHWRKQQNTGENDVSKYPVSEHHNPVQSKISSSVLSSHLPVKQTWLVYACGANCLYKGATMVAKFWKLSLSFSSWRKKEENILISEPNHQASY